MSRLKPARRLIQFAVLAGLASSTVATADAAVMTSYATFGPATVPQTHREGLELAKFNATLGTLTNVAITIMTSGTPDAIITNNTAAAIAYKNAEAQFSSGVSAPGLWIENVMTSGRFTGLAGPGVTTLSGGAQTLSNTANVGTSFFGAYEGTGNVTLSYRGGAYIASPSQAPLIFGGTETLSGKVTVTYTYTANPVAPAFAVPEPGTIVALASGLACLGLARLRRKGN